MIIFSPWKTKRSTRVIKSPIGVIFSTMLIKCESSHFSPFFLTVIIRVNAPNPSGSATYNKTERKSVSRGTWNPVDNPKRNIPIGVNTTKMRRSFIDTWINAQLRLARARNVQTRTIAVQGASARIIIPIIYSCCSFSGIQEEKTIVMKNQAIKAIVKGLTPNLWSQCRK